MLYGKFKNVTCEDFGVISRLFCMASDNAVQGQISFTDIIPFTPEQICGIINTTPEKLQHIVTYLEKENTIKTVKGIIYIVNWSKYQSDYERQKPYRNKDKNSKVTTQSYNEKLRIEREREEEVEVKQEKETKTKDPRVKILIDYFYQAHLTAGKGKLHINGGKDGQKFIDLLKTFSEAEIKTKIDLFMKYNDPWMSDKPYSIGMFSSQYNKILKTGKKESEIRTNGLQSADELIRGGRA
jgi:hypothetical protein